nr:hypothetical protein Iba_scaffold31550CG0010 [Ipomoea batatas]
MEAKSTPVTRPQEDDDLLERSTKKLKTMEEAPSASNVENDQINGVEASGARNAGLGEEQEEVSDDECLNAEEWVEGCLVIRLSKEEKNVGDVPVEDQPAITHHGDPPEVVVEEGDIVMDIDMQQEEQMVDGGNVSPFV